jgi:hypothetical protein
VFRVVEGEVHARGGGKVDCREFARNNGNNSDNRPVNRCEVAAPGYFNRDNGSDEVRFSTNS